MQNVPITNFKTYSLNFEVKIHTKKGLISFTDRVMRIETSTTVQDINGQFRIIFTPQEDADGKTIYDLVEPMSYIEISISKSSLPRLTTVFRGFVSLVSKTTDISSGKPQRAIIVVGENYGKVIRWSYIYYAAGLSPDPVIAALGTDAPFLFSYGIDLLTQNATPAKFITDVFNTIILKNFDKIRNVLSGKAGEQNSTIGTFGLDIDEDGVNGIRSNFPVSIFDPTAGAQTTSLYDLLNEFAAKPWNELYVDERPDGSFLVFRPTPWRDRNGVYVGNSQGVQIQGLDIDPVLILPQDIISLELSRSDEQVYNYYYTDAMFSYLGADYESFMMSRAFVKKENTLDPQYVIAKMSDKLAFSRMELFGFRQLKTNLKYLGVPGPLSGNGDMNQYEKDYGDGGPMVRIGEVYNQTLYNAFEHNSALEFGTVVTSGDEGLRPGMYIKIRTDRNDQKEHVYYITSLTHSVVPFDGLFTTSLQVARGEGWLNNNFVGETTPTGGN